MGKLAAALAAIGIALFTFLTWRTGSEPWFDPLLSIDGQHYAQGMAEIGSRRQFLKLNDLYHSPGYQLYLGALYALSGGRGTFYLVKWLAWLYAVLCIGMVYRLGETRFGRGAGAAGAVLLSFSSKWAAYINILQYEILLAFVLTSLCCLLPPPVEARRRIYAAASAGFFLMAACFIHFRLLALVPIAAACLWMNLGSELGRRERLTLFAWLFVPVVITTVAWSTYQSSRLREPVLIQRLVPWAQQFRIHNHPQAPAYAFPYVDPVEPSGLSFVLRRPFQYIWLTKERFLYLWDLRKDVWYIGPPPSPTDIPLRIAACLLFFSGVALKLREDLAKGSFRRDAIVYGTLLIALMPALLSTGSSRFLVPVLPIVCLFQAYGALRIAAVARIWPWKMGIRR